MHPRTILQGYNLRNVKSIDIIKCKHYIVFSHGIGLLQCPWGHSPNTCSAVGRALRWHRTAPRHSRQALASVPVGSCMQLWPRLSSINQYSAAWRLTFTQSSQYVLKWLIMPKLAFINKLRFLTTWKNWFELPQPILNLVTKENNARSLVTPLQCV